jgi:hypothetical protein
LLLKVVDHDIGHSTLAEEAKVLEPENRRQS